MEVGAHEAVYLVLQMPMRRTSRSFLFIDTNSPEDRVVMIKPMHVLEEMKDDSTDIDIVKLYQQRPKNIENICLADFVSKFSVKYKKRRILKMLSRMILTCQKQYFEYTLDDIIDSSEEEVLKHSYVFKNDTEIEQRMKQWVLRWVHFHKETDSENYFREPLMLFTHWRNENKDLLKNFGSYEES